MSKSQYPEFVPVAFIAAFSLLFILPLHIRSGSVATLALILWLFVTNIIYALDAFIWTKSVDIVAVTWCDITTKIIIGSNIATPSACFCVSVRLYRSSFPESPEKLAAEKLRTRVFEIVMCYALPITIMALHYIVQGHRFDIIQDYGCRPATYFSSLAIVILWIPPLLVSLLSSGFTVAALKNFLRNYNVLVTHASYRSMEVSYYVRLMIISVLQMFFSTAATTLVLCYNLVNGTIRPYTNWADVHFNFSRVDQVAAMFFTKSQAQAIYVTWWIAPASTFVFVAIFAFGPDSMDGYKMMCSWIRAHMPTWKSGSNDIQRTDKTLHTQDTYRMSLSSVIEISFPASNKSSQRFWEAKTIVSFPPQSSTTLSTYYSNASPV